MDKSTRTASFIVKFTATKDGEFERSYEETVSMARRRLMLVIEDNKHFFVTNGVKVDVEVVPYNPTTAS